MRIIPWFGYGIIFVSGLICGSFFTFLFYRIKNNEPWLWGRAATRSKCPSCGTVLKFRDLIPVLSWVMSGGQCRHCNQRVSIRYPLIEIGTALIFLLIWTIYLGWA